MKAIKPYILSIVAIGGFTLGLLYASSENVEIILSNGPWAIAIFGIVKVVTQSIEKVKLQKLAVEQLKSAS